MKKKILHITHTPIQSDNRILKELNTLSKNGYECYAFGIESKNNKQKVQLQNVTFKITKLRAKKITNIFRPIGHFISIIELFFKFYKLSSTVQPDLVHCHDTLVLPIGYLISKKYKSKLIYDAHELESNKNGQNLVLRYCTLLIEKIFWKRIDHLIVVSESIKRWYSKTMNFDNISVVLNSPDFDQNVQQSDLARKKFKISANEKVFVYLGIFMKGRFIPQILNVFKNDNVKSHLIFIGYGDMLNEITSVSDQYENIHVLGPVKHDKINEYIKGCNYGFCMIENVSLSDYYSLPNKLFEYCFSGLKIIGSKMPEINNIIKEYGLGFSIELSEDSLLETIMEIESDEIKKEDEEELFERFKNDLSWKAQSDKLIKIYKETL